MKSVRLVVKLMPKQTRKGLLFRPGDGKEQLTMEVIVDITKGVYKERIVRCKECKWCLVEEGGCERIGMVLFADEIENHFCGYGERKESE